MRKYKQILFECNYNEKGEKDGELKEFDLNGNLILLAIYFNDVLLKSTKYNTYSFVTEQISLINKHQINSWVNLYSVTQANAEFQLKLVGNFYFVKTHEIIQEPNIITTQWQIVNTNN